MGVILKLEQIRAFWIVIILLITVKIAIIMVLLGL